MGESAEGGWPTAGRAVPPAGFDPGALGDAPVLDLAAGGGPGFGAGPWLNRARRSRKLAIETDLSKSLQVDPDGSVVAAR
jgi:hypothetical protein